MEVHREIVSCRSACRRLSSLALVPTMGALHEGHLSLVKRALVDHRHVAVSIFVNPTQFGPSEDFTRYPRPVEQDLKLCRDAGVDVVFMPDASEMYPVGGPELRIDLPALTTRFEGALRPGHFSGVCQVVAKLFNIVSPESSYFGEKDFQQLSIIRAMVRALNMPIRVNACPTLRDADGLALSSRNRYLSPDERQRALSISRALRAARALVANGERNGVAVEALMKSILDDASSWPQVPTQFQYASVIDPVTFAPVERIESNSRAIVAMKVGSTRLIDNMLLDGNGEPGMEDADAA